MPTGLRRACPYAASTPRIPAASPDHSRPELQEGPHDKRPGRDLANPTPGLTTTQTELHIMAKLSHTPSRRAMLAGLAAAPVAGLPAIAGVVADDDPLLEALAEYERLHAIERTAWEAVADAAPTSNRLPEVVFNGNRVFSILHLETMRESSMGMTDEEIDDTIARLRKGNATMRAEAAGLEPEYQNARAVLEAHNAYAQNAETSEVLDAESAAQKAQDNAN
ncbi:hypothetical protein IYX23_00560 [Methylocystis sp. L43]|nr:hypothetical protein [Methylocystis sp. L43]